MRVSVPTFPLQLGSRTGPVRVLLGLEGFAV